MIQGLRFDENSAKRADGSDFISKTGDYIVTIKQVAAYETKMGATMLEFALKADDGRLAFPTVCIIAKDGSETFAWRQVQALMKLTGVTEAPFVAGKVYRRNGEKVDGHRVPSLEGKRIGVVLQHEDREYEVNGEIRRSYQMNVVTFFDPETRRVAREIINGEMEAKLLDQRLATLKDKPLKGETQQPATQASAQPPAGHPAFEDTDPF